MSAIRYLTLILDWLWLLPLTAATQTPTAANLLVSAQAEVTTMYLATATQAKATYSQPCHVDTYVKRVVGSSSTAEGFSHAFITDPDGKGMADLNSLVDLPEG